MAVRKKTSKAETDGATKRKVAAKAKVSDRYLTDQKFWSFLKKLNSDSEEKLDKTAIIDTDREFTYRQMYRQWDRYAEVFSSLSITAENNSRVGIGSHFTFREQIFSLYALNMTGASVSLFSLLGIMDMDRFCKNIQKEKITDLILSDCNLPPSSFHELLRRKESLGLRNIIMLHTPLRSLFVPKELEQINELNYRNLRKFPGVIWMEDALSDYDGMPITLDSEESRDTALILHTSGTTSGIRKPVPFSDKAFNASVARIISAEQFESFKDRAITGVYLPLDMGTSLMDNVHVTLCFGGTIVLDSFGCANLNVVLELVRRHKINFLFGNAKIVETWMKAPGPKDLSSLELFAFGGSYVSSETKKTLDAYIKRCGAKIGISTGYGLTELGAACFLTPPEREDASLGFPMNGIKVKLYDEDEDKYYGIEDGPRTGILVLSSDSVSSGRIDDEVFFELIDIDGEKYYNTCDRVELKEDGSFTYIGRMNKYFVNNEGIKFDAGLIETAVAESSGIKNCALAPVYDKLDLHDTVPVLYVEVEGNRGQQIHYVVEALRKIFIKDDAISKTNLPGQCVITDQIPFNTAGKVDTISVTEGMVDGMLFKVEPVWRKESLVDVKLVPVLNSKNNPMETQSGIPKELGKNIKSDTVLIMELQKKMMAENMPFIPNFAKKEGADMMNSMKNMFPCGGQMPGGYFAQQPPQMPGGYFAQQPPQMPGGNPGQQSPQMPGGYFAQQPPQMPGGYFGQQPPQMPGGYFAQQPPQMPGGYFGQRPPQMPGGDFGQQE